MIVSLELDDEDEFDLKLFDEAMEEYKKNPVTYSLEEVVKELGLD